jgi:hemerythrin-like domain-containing protein
MGTQGTKGQCMQTDVASILANLRQEHRNMTRLLNLLERESNRIEAEQDADIELMQDVMHYMTVYPDAVHHPKEDRIYAELKKIRPELSEGFSRITLDHHAIAEQGMQLRNDIELIQAGAMVKRKAVVRDALRYANTLRNHMQWEELDLFRRIEEMIKSGHRHLDTADWPHIADPVFGPQLEDRFRRLFDRAGRA